MEDRYKSMLEGKIKEESYIAVIPKFNNGLDFEKLKDKLRNSAFFSVEELEEHEEDGINTIKVKINYLDNEYKIEVRVFDMNDFMSKSIKDFNKLGGGYLTEYIEKIDSANKIIMTKMFYTNIPIEAYHLQLKVLYTLSSENYVAVDMAALKLLEGEYLEMIALAGTPPSPKVMYTIHYLRENGEAWLHTHGVRRFCGIEYEFLRIKDEFAEDYANVLNTVAVNSIVDKPMAEEEEAKIVYSDNRELSFAWLRWENALNVLQPKKLFGKKKQFIGDMRERVLEKGEINLHSEPSGVLLASINGELKSPDVYRDNLRNNVMLYYSTSETIRMSNFAKENFYYFENIFNTQKGNENWSFLVKVACIYKEGSEEKYEHMWFETEEINEETISGKLINTPYFINEMENGKVYRLEKNKLTDWLIYAPNMTIDANNIYVYNKLYNNTKSGRNS